MADESGAGESRRGSLVAEAFEGDPVTLARALVSIPSVNPDLEDGGAGEAEIARVCARWLREWGFDVALSEVEPGRANVVGRLGGGPKRLVLNGHLDTVGVEGMAFDPFAARISDGRLLGRGACDMKGGIAAILATARGMAADGWDGGELMVALTADEERASIGAQALVEAGLVADAAVVCEPTSLAVMPAHKGFIWCDLAFRGRAAHGSRPDLGVDAIRHAARFLGKLDDFEAGVLAAREHPLLGRPSLHAGTIRGGSAPSVYPAECTLTVERRTLPGEVDEEVVAEFREVLDELRRELPEVEAELSTGLARPGTEVDGDAPVVRGLRAAVEEEGVEARTEGMSAWVDAAFFNVGGIPSVCFGPGSIEQAHTAGEWAPVEEIEAAARILERFARAFLV